MDVLIMSDTHGDAAIIERISALYPNMAAYIHCGDSELSADAKELDMFTKVGGNCDMDKNYSDESIIEVNGANIYITHGHLYGVKSSLMALHYRAQEVGAKIVCFGHSHLLGAEMIEGTLFLNPGSLRMPRGRKEKSFIVLSILDDVYVVKCLDENNNLIVEAKYTK